MEQLWREQRIRHRYGRWYTSTWTGGEIEANMPAAVSLPDHFVVVLAIGRSNLGVGEEQVFYWDSADGQTHLVWMHTFEQRQPTVAYKRA